MPAGTWYLTEGKYDREKWKFNSLTCLLLRHIYYEILQDHIIQSIVCLFQSLGSASESPGRLNFMVNLLLSQKSSHCITKKLQRALFVT